MPTEALRKLRSRGAAWTLGVALRQDEETVHACLPVPVVVSLTAPLDHPPLPAHHPPPPAHFALLAHISEVLMVWKHELRVHQKRAHQPHVHQLGVHPSLAFERKFQAHRYQAQTFQAYTSQARTVHEQEQ